MTALAATELAEDRVPTAAAPSKSKRVRTGCLTCRERHLKCDEEYSASSQGCGNCRKSSRACKRGVRLNFIDTTVKNPPRLPPTADWKVQFQDESRDIAAEYQGGLARYAHLDQAMTPPREGHPYPARGDDSNALPPIHSAGPSPDPRADAPPRRPSRVRAAADRDPYGTAPPSTAAGPPEPPSPLPAPRKVLTSPEEVLFMQVFVEEVGLWMDSLDSEKHFSRILPFHALTEPMLLNAFLACGARHLTLVNPRYHEDRALFYYDTATTQLLRSLQNPDRDTGCCATTAVILNVYEIMSERAMQRMNHIAGARALIKECGWNARSTGIGAACFWLNVGMELLSCLHFNWQVAWDPDQWGVDMNLQPETAVGREELWVHRMLYIVGKIANFRASIPRFREASPHDEQLRLQSRYAEWQRLKELCDRWDASVPRTMQPMGYLPAGPTRSTSAFAEVWLIKRATIVGRLFYHTAVCLLAQINPLQSRDTDEMNTMQMHHAHLICGIVAHVKDRGLRASPSGLSRSPPNASPAAASRTRSWRSSRRSGKRRGGRWASSARSSRRDGAGRGTPRPRRPRRPRAARPRVSSSPRPQHRPRAARRRPPARPGLPSGILNPLLAKADFSLPNHPYQQYYQPPSHAPPASNTHFPPPAPNQHPFPPPYA
ncbi:hypothetical protein PZA11_007933 [Diplocarpon coronariae]